MVMRAMNNIGLRKFNGSRSFKTDKFLTVVLFLGPVLVGLFVFQWLPLGVAIKNSFLQFSPLNPDAARVVWLDNYLSLLSNERFQRAAINTLIYIFGKLAIQIPLGLLLAMLLDKALPGTTLIRGAVFAALVSSEAVMALLWNILYTPDVGLINSLLAAIGLPKQPFLISTSQAMPALLVMIVWKDIGFTMLILLSGLQTIPREFYDAAAIDGAGSWAKLRHITIPLLKRMLLLAIFMATIAGSRVFTPIILMTDGGPQDATINSVFYMYEQAFRYQRMGEASTTAVYLILFLILISLVEGWVFKTEHEY